MAQLEAQVPTQNEIAAPMVQPVVLTEKAAEMVKQAMQQENYTGPGLRIGVIGGGCSGLQYLLNFVEPGESIEEDFVNEQFGLAVHVDPFSAGHLTGTTVDYVDSLHGSGFKFNNPNIQKSCGCGSSFQT